MQAIVDLGGLLGHAAVDGAGKAPRWAKRPADAQSLAALPAKATTPAFTELKAELTEPVRVEVRAAQAAMAAGEAAG